MIEKILALNFEKGQKFILRRYAILCNFKGHGIGRHYPKQIVTYLGERENPILNKPWVLVEIAGIKGILNPKAIIGFDYSQDPKRIKEKEENEKHTK